MTVREVLDAAVTDEVAEMVQRDKHREKRPAYIQWWHYTQIATHADYDLPSRQVNEFLESIHPANRK